MNDSKYRVLITYVEAGMGHMTSAEAVANALEKYYPDEVEVVRTNIFTDTNEKKLIDYQEFLIKAVKKSNKHPSSMFYMKYLRMRLFPRLWTLRKVHSWFFRKQKNRCIEIMKSFEPDMTFHTHFTPVHLAIEAQNKRYGGHFLSAFYDPDPNTHGWWDKRADLAVFNNEGAYREALRFGFRPENCVLGRFLLRKKVMNACKDKLALREKYHLPENNFTVTLASSAYAGGLLKKFANAILQIDRPMTLLIIAGSNQKVYDEMSRLVGHTGKIDLRVYPFMPDAHELYGASDIFITKAGPNAILDSVYMGTPVMTNFCASLIERATKTYYIDEKKTGVHCKNPKKATDFLLACMDDPSILEPYIQNCRRFVENNTGGEKLIADVIVERLRKNGPPKPKKPLEKAEETPKTEQENPVPVA